MRLTEENKKVINKILLKEINSIESYVKSELKFKEMETTYDTNIKIGLDSVGGRLHVPTKSKVIIIDLEDRVKVFEFIALLHQLEEEGLILSLNTSSQQGIRNATCFYDVFSGVARPDVDTLHTLYNHTGKKIIILNRLEEFVERDYLTNYEYELLVERRIAEANMTLAKKHSKQGTWLAIIIALLTAVISSGISLYSSYLDKESASYDSEMIKEISVDITSSIEKIELDLERLIELSDQNKLNIISEQLEELIKNNSELVDVFKKNN